MWSRFSYPFAALVASFLLTQLAANNLTAWGTLRGDSRIAPPGFQFNGRSKCNRFFKWWPK
jgi:hypothetical protein